MTGLLNGGLRSGLAAACCVAALCCDQTAHAAPGPVMDLQTNPKLHIGQSQVVPASTPTMGYILRNTAVELFSTAEIDPKTCKLLDDPKLNASPAPVHGKVTSEIMNQAVPPGNACAGTVLPHTLAIYTWTDTAKTGTIDSFTVTALYQHSLPQSASYELTLAPTLTLARTDLLTVSANALPSGNAGVFSYVKTIAAGTRVAGIGLAPGVTNTTKPNVTKLANPPNPGGAPQQGGLGQYQVNYAIGTNVANNDPANPFKVPVFGLSCYFITLESDWGTPPNACKSVRIGTTTYSGTIQNPGGYPGTYCDAFYGEVKLQGSGELTNGTKLQYNATNGTIHSVTSITGHDGTPVVAGQTAARALSIIPAHGVKVDISGETSRTANDTGGAILSYRLDLFQGAGVAVCNHFTNPISVAACTPAQTACPGSALK